MNIASFGELEGQIVSFVIVVGIFVLTILMGYTKIQNNDLFGIEWFGILALMCMAALIYFGWNLWKMGNYSDTACLVKK